MEWTTLFCVFQKARKKAKGKDQRRRAAMDAAASREAEPSTPQNGEPDDEVERALAEAARHIEGYLSLLSSYIMPLYNRR